MTVVLKLSKKEVYSTCALYATCGTTIDASYYSLRATKYSVLLQTSLGKPENGGLNIETVFVTILLLSLVDSLPNRENPSCLHTTVASV